MSSTMNSIQPVATKHGISLTASDLGGIVGGDGKAAQTTTTHTTFLRFDFALVAVTTV